jgi:hypothetical protein
MEKPLFEMHAIFSKTSRSGRIQKKLYASASDGRTDEIAPSLLGATGGTHVQRKIADEL